MKKLIILLSLLVGAMLLTGCMEQPGEIDDENGEEEGEQTANVDLYFMEVVDGTEQTVPIQREIDLDNGQEESALKALIQGPTDEEQDEGYSSAIDQATQVLSFEIEEGVATVDFSSELEPAGGSAMVMSIQEQINNTLTQFESIDEVVIMVEGQSEDILQP
ncbi:GerMN domain-containing protein [Candidatus Absconditicoccus praedator]|uniref:GerMN domain-containing protein n=1 Tax=Candidatus Absconditicoccus praedator TaxID=2735562 RepID=UPI001E431B6A|nr:GerMN domain-containing protein [Candidatus Absconditicoccus praedator]UFX83162.1 GerMN domain-containing protein [Candidatus Absconditicoccus praedator]